MTKRTNATTTGKLFRIATIPFILFQVANLGANTVPEDLMRVFPNPTAMGYEHFGWSLAILSGDLIAIGAYEANAGGTKSGSVYLFDVSTGLPVRTIPNPFPDTGDEFGRSLASMLLVSSVCLLSA